MVAYEQVKASNRLINEETGPRVAVFVGGTSGIGRLTLAALIATGTPVRIYVVGRRGAEERTRTLFRDLNAKTTDPRAELVWVEAEVSLLAETRRACDFICGRESRVDLLFLTVGYAPFGPREETVEGIEITQSLGYYARMLFVLRLLPLLETSRGGGRVVSVLGHGLEPRGAALDDLADDPDLRRPGAFGLVAAQTRYAVMNTATLDRLARDHPAVTFVHSSPGWVNTGNVWRGIADQNSLTGWLVWLFLEPIIALFSFSDDESGQRHLFQCTSAAFGGSGVTWTGKVGVNSFGKPENGLFLVSSKCDCNLSSKVMSELREKTQTKVWDHTQQVLGPYL